MARTTGVGIVGLSADGGWGARGHLPALTELDGYEVRGLAASTADSARRAGEKYGIGLAVADPLALAAHPDIDLVALCVRVPRHAELVERVVGAGKAILCEWPLARDAAEAARLAELAAGAGVRTAVGLQARSTPTVRYVRDLVARGYVGSVLSTTLVGSGGGWTDPVARRSAYMLDQANGATMLAIPFGHTVDAMAFVLGGLRDVTATTAVVRPLSTVQETGDRIEKTVADQVAVTGTLRGGGVCAVHYRGGSSAGTNFLWEINGTDGDLVLRGPTGHLQFDQAEVSGARRGEELSPLPVPDSYVLTPGTLDRTSPARPVAHAYARLRSDLETGTRTVPDFADGAAHHTILAAIEESARTGRRMALTA
jgi:predicted dehydrogenase